MLVWRLGTGPFLDGLRAIDGAALAAAAGIAAGHHGLLRLAVEPGGPRPRRRLPLRAAVAAYYRSQFLNTTLPGGVLGDVHRGVRHGRDVGDVGRGLRAVGWERTAGQVVQVVLPSSCCSRCPSPVQLVDAAASRSRLVAAVARRACSLAGRGRAAGRPAGARRCARSRADVRAGLLARRAWPASSLGVRAWSSPGTRATFLVAARDRRHRRAARSQLLPLALLVLLAMACRRTSRGWGPREGVAAWAFAAAGLGADQGVATAVVYGVMVLVASLPGRVVLVGGLAAASGCAGRGAAAAAGVPVVATATAPRDG